jgi:hypothetical protein
LAPQTRGETFVWVVDANDILCIHSLQALQEASFYLEASQHLPQHFIWHNIKCIFEVHKTTIDWLFFYIALFY